MIAYGCQNFVVVFDPKSVQVRDATEMFCIINWPFPSCFEPHYDTKC